MRKYLLLVSLLIGWRLGAAQTIGLDVRLQPITGLHTFNGQYWKGFSSSKLEYPVKGNVYWIEGGIQKWKLKMFCQFGFADFKGYGYDTDWYLDFLEHRAGFDNRTNFEHLVIGMSYRIYNGFVDVDLSVQRLKYSLKHQMTNGKSYLSFGYPTGKEFSGLQSTYQSNVWGWGFGLEFDLGKFIGHVDCYPKVKNEEIGWWNLRFLRFTHSNFCRVVTGGIDYSIVELDWKNANIEFYLGYNFLYEYMIRPWKQFSVSGIDVDPDDWAEYEAFDGEKFYHGFLIGLKFEVVK